MARRQRDQLLALDDEEGVGADQEGVGALLHQGREGRFDFAFGAGV